MDLTNPLTFVGQFDARSVMLAGLFTAPWLIALAWGRLRRGWLWAALIAAAALFPISIAWVQVPIQLGLNALWTRLLDPDTASRYVLLVGLPSVAVSGLVQEGVKLLIAVAALRMMSGQRQGLTALAVGAAAGAGYGGFEAFWTFNTIFATGWSWTAVDLGGWMALLGFIERAFAVPFHVGIAALAAYGYSLGRVKTAYLAAAGAHTLLNFGVLLAQVGVLNTIGVEIWVGVIALIVVGLALWLRWRPAKPDSSGRSTLGHSIEL